ncbi:unnamed protein product [Cylicocyclus nassatus]|uniref:Uncharacterized protein n=1 Tax=Cylicocyclus nassatus TaxID=53992 RepID=A0AA36HAX4_CYLNA|nr:unnamed protein product [Cylicocyclus nassatus]
MFSATVFYRKMGHKGKHENGENNNDVAYMTEDGIPSENGMHAKAIKGKSRPSDGRYALYLVRKPIEVTPEDLSKASISIEACVDNEQKITIGSNDFVVRGAALPSQTFHIPASVLHASDASSSLEAGKVIGSIVISRAEFHSTDGIYEEGHDVPLDLLQNLPLRHIKKKVSRKGIKHLRQRLCANGVKRLSSSGSAAAQ